MQATESVAAAPTCPRCQNALRYLYATDVWVCDFDQISFPGRSWCTTCASPGEPFAKFCASCGSPLPGTLPRASFGRLGGYSYRVWRENPSIILPTLLVNAASMVSQAAVLAVMVALLSYVALSGDLAYIVRSIELIDPSRWPVVVPDRIASIFYGTLPVLILTLVAWIALQITFGSLATSIEYSAYARIIRARAVTVRDFLEEGIHGWRRMMSAYIAVNLVSGIPILLGLMVIIVGLIEGPPFDMSVPPTLGESMFMISMLAFGSLLLLIGAVAWTLTTFSYPAVAVGGLSGFGAIASSLGTIRRSFLQWLAYGVFRIGLVMALGLASVVVQYFGVTIGALVSALIVVSVTPILHMLKTSIHAASHDQAVGTDIMRRVAEPESVPTLNIMITGKVAPTVKIALATLARFAVSPRNLGFHAIAVVAFLSAYVFGEFVSVGGMRDALLSIGYLPGRINQEFLQLQAPFLSLDLFFHNWMVSMNVAFAGAAFVFPTVSALFFNGWIIGIIRPLTPSQAMFLAAILPHGAVEIPAFLLSGSAGIRLGVQTARALRLQGPERLTAIRNSLRETTLIVLGLAPLYLIAGVIEGTITPIIMRMYGWS